MPNNVTIAEAFAGGIRYKRADGSVALVRVTADYVFPVDEANDRMVVENITSGALRTITLPPVTGVPVGDRIEIKDGTGLAGTDFLIVTPDGTDTIDGGAVYSILVNWGFVTLQATPSGWRVVEQSLPRAGVTAAQANAGLSVEQTGTGAEQAIAHGRTGTPQIVFVVWSDLTPATVGQAAYTLGVQDATLSRVTVTNGKKYRLFTWA